MKLKRQRVIFFARKCIQKCMKVIILEYMKYKTKMGKHIQNLKNECHKDFSCSHVFYKLNLNPFHI